MFKFFAYPFHITLFVVFLVMQGSFITTIPGLMGDEAHEGQNVFHMLDQKKIEVVGERSYIGAGIDYVRIPFVISFGYTLLALRLLTFVASAIFFVLSACLLVKYLGKDQSLIPLLFLTYSPIYVTQQRLAWAITLLPLFAVAMIWLLQSSWKHKYLLAGLVGGLGLSNHLVFLPTLIAIIGVFYVIKFRVLLSTWPIIVGFIAGFAMQFTILQLYPDDQGSQKVIAETFLTRVQALPALFPEIISGSSYIASYTGHELTPVHKMATTSLLSLFVIIALLFSKHKKIAWIIALALTIHVLVLLRIVDRFSLRYFTVFVLGFWMLAGTGVEAIIALLRRGSVFGSRLIICMICLGLLCWAIIGIVLPYQKTGGSTNLFSLGNRTDSASALVDTRQLFACVNNLGLVTSENVHIYNRLEFWSRQYPGVQFIDEEHKKSAEYTVDYRISGKNTSDIPGIVCPQLTHFRITKR